MKDSLSTRYRFIINEIDERRRKIDDMRYEVNQIEERMKQLESWRDEMKAQMCPHCNGAGKVNEWRDQDDCKTITCSYCKGSGERITEGE